MRRFLLALSLAAVITAGTSSATSASPAAVARSAGTDLCVSQSNRGCFKTLQAAFHAADDGDRIRIDRGTYAGGVTVKVSVRIEGAGARLTTISGGGPVLTIGEAKAATEPTVTVSGVTITGGYSRASGFCGPQCSAPSYAQATALGGGIEVPPAAANGPGATVTISDSVIRGNRVAPTTTVASVKACSEGVPCRFALAGGGGIDNWGSMTLIRTQVAGNEVAGPASDAVGGGILNERSATLTLNRVLLTHNRALAGEPNGRFAEGGGIFAEGDGGSVSIRNSLVTSNDAILTSTLASTPGVHVVDMSANSGAIHIGDGVDTTVENTAMLRNTVRADDLLGEPVAFDSAMLVGDSMLTMRNSIISGNRVGGASLTSADVGPGGSALELDGPGTITNTRITDNTSIAESPSGDAAVNGAVAVLNFNGDPQLVLIRDSVVSDNTAYASTSTGTATVQGGGIFNNSLLELRDVAVTNNIGRAAGPSGAAEGGGIWNGVELSGPPVELTLTRTKVTHNSLIGGPGITLRGGGVFTNLPITATQTVIAGNVPDQCVGC